MVAPNDPSAQSSAPSSTQSASSNGPASPRKRRANQRNAQQSTGPRTPEGKARSSRNATTHGIFCRDVVLPGESFEQFEMIRDGFVDALKPQDAAQLAVVDTAVSARWRLNRCQFAEATLIERRIAAATAKVKEQFDSLGRNMRYEDFSAAAIDAQCAKSEVFRQHFQQWKDLRDAKQQSLHPGHALAALMHTDRHGDQPLERLSRYEHRLEQSFHRCLRDLHVLKQRAKQYADEPPSPFRTRHGVADELHDAAHRGLGVPPEHSSAATESAATSAENPPVQNEPTASDTAASPAPADGCNAPATPPDPAEMAALQKFADLLSRCRPRDDAEERDDDYREDLMT